MDERYQEVIGTEKTLKKNHPGVYIKIIVYSAVNLTK